eukprot:TRINITY_DN5511_c0_g1_i3.p1 TRINITY_DN5511_c0_g1~~TRINITY_DN5511_c0_g1_i3.p1  ORF type:complete len:596 (-),score=145.63 TRINITY_DN5511_c0_g1_i3:1130-2680(-)
MGGCQLLCVAPVSRHVSAERLPSALGARAMSMEWALPSSRAMSIELAGESLGRLLQPPGGGPGGLLAAGGGDGAAGDDAPAGADYLPLSADFAAALSAITFEQPPPPAPTALPPSLPPLLGARAPSGGTPPRVAKGEGELLGRPLPPPDVRPRRPLVGNRQRRDGNAVGRQRRVDAGAGGGRSRRLGGRPADARRDGGGQPVPPLPLPADSQADAGRASAIPRRRRGAVFDAHAQGGITHCPAPVGAVGLPSPFPPAGLIAHRVGRQQRPRERRWQRQWRWRRVARRHPHCLPPQSYASLAPPSRHASALPATPGAYASAPMPATLGGFSAASLAASLHNSAAAAAAAVNAECKENSAASRSVSHSGSSSESLPPTATWRRAAAARGRRRSRRRRRGRAKRRPRRRPHGQWRQRHPPRATQPQGQAPCIAGAAAVGDRGRRRGGRGAGSGSGRGNDGNHHASGQTASVQGSGRVARSADGGVGGRRPVYGEQAAGCGTGRRGHPPPDERARRHRRA